MSRDLVEKIKHNGFTIKFFYDPDCSSPRENSNNGFFLGYKHRDYNIGDEQADPENWAFDCTCKALDSQYAGEVTFPIMGEEVTVTCSLCEGYGEKSVRSFEDAVRYVRENYGAIGPVLPVVMYDHGSVSYSVGRTYDAWDGGNAGLIFATHDLLKETQGEGYEMPSDEDLTAWLTGEIEEYSSWAEGDCYGYVTTDKNGDEVDSCWGFIGMQWAKESAISECPDEDTQPVLRTLRFSDKTLDTIEAALETCKVLIEHDEPSEIPLEDFTAALAIVTGARLGGDPEGAGRYGTVYSLTAHPPLVNAGRTASFQLTPVQRRDYAERGWHKQS